jgi:chromosome partitioning protein
VLLNGACPVREAIVPVRPNLEILPSNMDLALAELEFAGLEGREGRLKVVIDGLRESYDYVVIDCPPSIGILTINALVASDLAIVPVAPSSLSVCGLSRVLHILDALKELHLLDLTVYFLTTFFERRLREARHHRQELERVHGEHLLKTVIRKSTRLNEATREGIPIFEYDRRDRGSRDYSDLAAEILAIGSGKEGAAEDAVVRRSVL